MDVPSEHLLLCRLLRWLMTGMEVREILSSQRFFDEDLQVCSFTAQSLIRLEWTLR